jgi:Fe-S-cluster containining protein
METEIIEQAEGNLLAEAYHLRQAERETANEILGKRKSRARLIELVDEAAGLAELMICQISSFEVDCGPGCDWCCFQRVSATPAEVLRIADFLRQTRTPEELAVLQHALTETDSQTRGLTADQRLRLKQLCPLLVGGGCSIYPVRPLTCRGYTSNSAALCQRKVEEPEQPVKVEADPVRYIFCQGVLNGLDDGLADHGLENGMVELIAALRIALDDPNSLKRWLKGERLFAEALSTPAPNLPD